MKYNVLKSINNSQLNGKLKIDNLINLLLTFIYNIIISDQYRYMHDTCTGIKLTSFYKNIDLLSKNCLNDTFAVLKTS